MACHHHQVSLTQWDRQRYDFNRQRKVREKEEKREEETDRHQSEAASSQEA